MRQQELERVAKLALHHAATEVPEDVDLRARLHARLAAEAQPTTNSVARRAPTSPGARQAPIRTPAFAFQRSHAVALLLVATLVVSGFAFARPLILGWFGDSALKAISIKDATTINRSVTTHGVTLTLEQGYADAARTVLSMRIRLHGSTQAVQPQLGGAMRLIDAQGAVYTAFTGSQIQNDGLFEFPPLRSDELGTTQALTLVAGSVLITSTGNLAGPGDVLDGPWSITFQLHAQAARSVPFSAMAQTHHGITLAPLRIDRAPSGARLLVRISGLAPDTSLFTLTHFVRTGDDIIGCPPGTHMCVESSGGTSDGALLQLKTTSGQILTPAWIEVLAPTTGDPMRANAASVVGPSGGAVLEFLFFTPLDTGTRTVQLTADQVRVATVGPTSTEQRIEGPWTFTLPLA